MIIKFLNNNLKKALARQQTLKSTSPLVPVISVYPYRKGSPVKVVYVKSTCLPPFKYASHANWAQRMSMELRFMVSEEEAKGIYNPFAQKGGDHV